MEMVVIKLSLLSCSEVHLLGSSPNHSCLKLSFFKNFKGDNGYGITDFNQFIVVRRRIIHLFNARKHIIVTNCYK